MKFTLGGDLRCDLTVLVDTRLLVQANSGGGKSHTLRRLLEPAIRRRILVRRSC